MKLLQNLALLTAWSGVCLAQTTTIPDGTKLRVRLNHPLSSATAQEGQSVELSVAEALKVDDVVVIKEGARVTGTVTQAVPKRRMGRAGKLDFSIDRVAAADEQWIPIRYSLLKQSGKSHSLRTGIITAGVAVAFWPAAPVVLLMKGKDININKGVTFDVFTDSPHSLASVAPIAKPVASEAARALPTTVPAPAIPSGSATITITASAPGADIEVDGQFVGNTPTTLQVPAGKHHVTVKSGYQSWQRTVQVSGGSTVSLNAVLNQNAPVAARQ